MSKATPKIKQEGMVTKQRAIDRFVNRYRNLDDELLKAKRRHELKPDSVSKKAIKTAKARLSDAKADWMSAYGEGYDVPRVIQDLFEAPPALKGIGSVRRQIRRSDAGTPKKYAKGGVAKGFKGHF